MFFLLHISNLRNKKKKKKKKGLFNFSCECSVARLPWVNQSGLHESTFIMCFDTIKWMVLVGSNDSEQLDLMR